MSLRKISRIYKLNKFTLVNAKTNIDIFLSIAHTVIAPDIAKWLIVFA